MSWTVLSVSYPFAPVSQDAVGGAEQVLAMLDRALVEAGHRSLVVAPEGSRVSGELIPLPPVPDLIDDTVRQRVHESTRDAIARTLRRERIDLVHMHGIDFGRYLPAPGVPVLVTLHLPLAWYGHDVSGVQRPETYFQCVSSEQARTAPTGVDLLPSIPNGVEVEHFHTARLKRHFALFLGRICPEKGVHIALRACRAASLPLLIGGQVYPYPDHQRYFEEEVRPLLDECRRFLGPLKYERKIALLAAAHSVVIPSLAPETSSLVAMEALASGTPVVAFKAGALTEIVDDGRTGFLVEDEAGLMEALRRTTEINPETCRAESRRRFGSDRTIRSYFELYARLARS